MSGADPPSVGDRSQVLIDSDWLIEHLDDPTLVLLEVDDRPALYHLGHPPGARLVNWREDLQDPVRRDLPSPTAVADLWRRNGISQESTVVLYGDLHNWLAAYGYWLFRAYGLHNVHLLDGGRQHWITSNLPLTTRIPAQAPIIGPPPAPRPRPHFRASRTDVVNASRAGSLLDVRTPQEYTGQWLTEPEYPGEAAHRPGHIPGALSLPWDTVITPNGLMKPAEELHALFEQAALSTASPIVTYCRIGERSAHTWVVLHDLLGHPDVSNYDGSWTEWGSMTGMPIQLTSDPGQLPPSFTP